MRWVPKHQSGWLKWYFSRNNEISVSGVAKKSILSPQPKLWARRFLQSGEKKREAFAFSLLWVHSYIQIDISCPEIKKNFILDTAVCHCYQKYKRNFEPPLFLSRNDFKQREEIHSVEDTLTHTQSPRALFFSLTLCVCTPSLTEKRARDILYLPRFLSYFHKGKVNRAQWDGICANNASLAASFRSQSALLRWKLHLAHANVAVTLRGLPN